MATERHLLRWAYELKLWFSTYEIKVVYEKTIGRTMKLAKIDGIVNVLI